MLVFVTDEISLPIKPRKIVCDLLALHVDGGRSTPVLTELKDSRILTRLVEQVGAMVPSSTTMPTCSPSSTARSWARTWGTRSVWDLAGAAFVELC